MKKAIILAAGKGKRMKSELQKVMHPILGKPIVQYVAEAAKNAGFDDITVVVGQDGGDIKNGLEANCGELFFAVQDEPLGTGHAVLAGATRIENDDDVIVLCGDMPLVTGDFIRELVAFGEKNPADAIVAAVWRDEIGDFGRVYDDDGDFVEIVEARDMRRAVPAHNFEGLSQQENRRLEHAIPEKNFRENSISRKKNFRENSNSCEENFRAETNWGNTGIYLFKGVALLHGLKHMKNENSQNEYYLTDVPKILREEGRPVRVFHTRADMSVFTGINTQIHLAEAVSFMQKRVNERHMANGVRMVSPATVFIDDAVKIAPSVIYPNVILEGACEIGAGAVIGAGSHLTDTIVGEGAFVRQSVTIGAKIGAHTEVGPFAYLRPGAEIGENCRIGNFVEVKNSKLGNGTKMAHLSYIGDADVGNGVNYSCGAITANYDGAKKFRTTIGDNAFIGSNANLVAPVTIGDNAFVAAGSTITDDLPPCALGIARQRQSVKPNWKRVGDS